MSLTATLLALTVFTASIPECYIPNNKITVLVNGRTLEDLTLVRTRFHKAAYLCKKTTTYLGLWENTDYFIWAGYYDSLSNKKVESIRELLAPNDVYILTPKKKAFGY